MVIPWPFYNLNLKSNGPMVAMGAHPLVTWVLVRGHWNCRLRSQSHHGCDQDLMQQVGIDGRKQNGKRGRISSNGVFFYVGYGLWECFLGISWKGDCSLEKEVIRRIEDWYQSRVSRSFSSRPFFVWGWKLLCFLGWQTWITSSLGINCCPEN